MTNLEPGVAVVVDQNFGDQLAALSQRLHVWACSSSRNREVAEQVWAGPPTHSLSRGITTFEYDPADSPADIVLGVLDEVELHHGEVSHDPEWRTLEVYGAALTPSLKTALRKLGVTRFESVEQGFRAFRFR